MPGPGPARGGDQIGFGLDLAADARAGDAVEIPRYDHRTGKGGSPIREASCLDDLAPLELKGPRACQVDAHHGDRTQRGFRYHPRGIQLLGEGVHRSDREARGEDIARRAPSARVGPADDPVWIGSDDAVETRDEGLADLHQHDHVGVRCLNRSGDGRDVLVLDPDIGGIERDDGRTGPGLAGPRKPLGPAGDQQDQDRCHGSTQRHAQPQGQADEGDQRSREDRRADELGEDVDPPMADTAQGGHADGQRRPHQKQQGTSQDQSDA